MDVSFSFSVGITFCNCTIFGIADGSSAGVFCPLFLYNERIHCTCIYSFLLASTAVFCLISFILVLRLLIIFSSLLSGHWSFTNSAKKTESILVGLLLKVITFRAIIMQLCDITHIVNVIIIIINLPACHGLYSI